MRDLRAQLERIRDQIDLEPAGSAQQQAAAEQSRLARRLKDIGESRRGGEVIGLLGPLEIDAATFERDLIVGGARRREAANRCVTRHASAGRAGRGRLLRSPPSACARWTRPPVCDPRDRGPRPGARIRRGAESYPHRLDRVALAIAGAGLRRGAAERAELASPGGLPGQGDGRRRRSGAGGAAGVCGGPVSLTSSPPGCPRPATSPRTELLRERRRPERLCAARVHRHGDGTARCGSPGLTTAGRPNPAPSRLHGQHRRRLLRHLRQPGRCPARPRCLPGDPPGRTAEPDLPREALTARPRLAARVDPDPRLQPARLRRAGFPPRRNQRSKITRRVHSGSQRLRSARLGAGLTRVPPAPEIDAARRSWSIPRCPRGSAPAPSAARRSVAGGTACRAGPKASVPGAAPRSPSLPS